MSCDDSERILNRDPHIEIKATLIRLDPTNLHIERAAATIPGTSLLPETAACSALPC